MIKIKQDFESGFTKILEFLYENVFRFENLLFLSPSFIKENHIKNITYFFESYDVKFNSLSFDEISNHHKDKYDLLIIYDSDNLIADLELNDMLTKLKNMSQVILFFSDASSIIKTNTKLTMSSVVSSFNSFGFTHYDCIRHFFWYDSLINVKFKNLLCLFAKQNYILTIKNKKLDDVLKYPVDIVHPELYFYPNSSTQANEAFALKHQLNQIYASDSWKIIMRIQGFLNKHPSLRRILQKLILIFKKFK